MECKKRSHLHYAGRKICTCNICGHEYSKKFEISHNWNSATCNSSQICTICGITQGNPLEHNYDIDCKCKNCDKKISFNFITPDPTASSPIQIDTIKNSNISSSCLIESIDKKIVSYANNQINLAITLSGKKIFDVNGDNCNTACKIAYKLYDSDNYVVDSGVIDTHLLSNNDSFKNITISFNNLEESTYKLELIDYIEN